MESGSGNLGGSEQVEDDPFRCALSTGRTDDRGNSFHAEPGLRIICATNPPGPRNSISRTLLHCLPASHEAAAGVTEIEDTRGADYSAGRCDII